MTSSTDLHPDQREPLEAFIHDMRAGRSPYEGGDQ